METCDNIRWESDHIILIKKTADIVLTVILLVAPLSWDEQSSEHDLWRPSQGSLFIEDENIVHSVSRDSSTVEAPCQSFLLRDRACRGLFKLWVNVVVFGVPELRTSFAIVDHCLNYDSSS